MKTRKLIVAAALVSTVSAAQAFAPNVVGNTLTTQNNRQQQQAVQSLAYGAFVQVGATSAGSASAKASTDKWVRTAIVVAKAIWDIWDIWTGSRVAGDGGGQSGSNRTADKFFAVLRKQGDAKERGFKIDAALTEFTGNKNASNVWGDCTGRDQWRKWILKRIPSIPGTQQRLADITAIAAAGYDAAKYRKLNDGQANTAAKQTAVLAAVILSQGGTIPEAIGGSSCIVVLPQIPPGI